MNKVLFFGFFDNVYSAYDENLNKTVLPLRRKNANVLHSSGYFVDGDVFYSGDLAFQEYLDLKSFDGAFNHLDGAFLCIYEFGNKVFVKSDSHSLEPVFYFQVNGGVYISTSLFLMVQVLFENGINLYFDHSVLELFFNKQSVYDTVFSYNTIVDGLRLVRFNSFLLLDYSCDSLNEKHLFFQEIYLNTVNFVADGRCYEDLLISSIDHMLRRIKMASMVSGSSVLTLSGGSDSRITYALFSQLKESSVQVMSSGDGKDYHCASQLCSYDKIQLFRSFPNRSPECLSPEEALRFFDLNSLGVYHFFEITQAQHRPYDFLEIRGGGGEAGPRTSYSLSDEGLSGFGVKSTQSRDFLLSDLTPSIGYLPLRDIHYMGFRNRMHIGRFSSESVRAIARIDPMCNSELKAASSLLNTRQRDSLQIYADILLYVNPLYAFFPFDSIAKSISPEVVRRSSLYGLKFNMPNLDNIRLNVKSSVDSSEVNFDKRNRSWISDKLFAEEILAKVSSVIEANLPSVFSHHYSDAMSVIASSKLGIKNSGRQLSKCYSISMLIQLGVKF